MTILSITSDNDYALAFQRVNELMDAEPNSKEFDELNILVTLIEKYEEQYYKI